jgi:hypothetical protein
MESPARSFEELRRRVHTGSTIHPSGGTDALTTASPLGRLRSRLESASRGLVSDPRPVVEMLARAWDDLDGSGCGGMASSKLARAEKLLWDPPLLSFVIERHGAMVAGGSSRAEMQRWVVDVEAGSVDVQTAGYRQARSMSPRLDVRPLAARAFEAANAGVDDDALKWWAVDRSKVTILVGKLIPDDGPKQTLIGRRRRLGDALHDQFTAAGWAHVLGSSPHTFVRVA